MCVKVAKFGGSSVADGIQIRKIEKIINSDPDLRYIIVSAPGKRFENDNKITDILYLCYTHMVHNLPYHQLFQVIADRFTATAANLGLDVSMISKELSKVNADMEDGCNEDYIASRGEYLNARIIAEYLGYDFVDTKELIIFDERGRLLPDETDKRISEELAKHDKAVLPGFYGSIENTSKIKTFSRGGSDISGAVVAKALKADVYENWTDVSGFLMADPKIVENPLPIHTISYKELRELSYMGASVLHEDAISPVKEAGIPIHIKNTNDPDDPGTVIRQEHVESDDEIITGIAGKKEFTVIALYKNMMSSERGFVRKILGILEDFECNFEHLPSGIDSVSVVISKKDLAGRRDEIMETFRKQLEPDEMECYENISLIATVGCGMSRRKGVAAKLFTALADADINMRMIEQGSSEINIIVGVEDRDFEDAIRAIYKAFTNDE
jgi:aspartate kinase